MDSLLLVMGSRGSAPIAPPIDQEIPVKIVEQDSGFPLQTRAQVSSFFLYFHFSGRPRFKLKIKSHVQAVVAMDFQINAIKQLESASLAKMVQPETIAKVVLAQQFLIQALGAKVFFFLLLLQDT